MVELNGALSNPQVQVELWKLYQLELNLLSRETRPVRKIAEDRLQPRTRVPVIQTITQVLQLVHPQPMRVKDIHEACERLLGTKMSYRSLKASLSAGSRGRKAKFVRVGHGRNRLSVILQQLI